MSYKPDLIDRNALLANMNPTMILDAGLELIKACPSVNLPEPPGTVKMVIPCPRFTLLLAVGSPYAGDEASFYPEHIKAELSRGWVSGMLTAGRKIEPREVAFSVPAPISVEQVDGLFEFTFVRDKVEKIIFRAILDQLVDTL